MSVRVTWWGHATVTISIGGYRVLTDPLLVGRLAHLRRLGGPLPGPAASRADVVLISHLHADHLHLPSLSRLAPAVTLVAPHGTAAVLRAAGRRWHARLLEVGPGDVVEVGPGNGIEVGWGDAGDVAAGDAAQRSGALRITAVPARHPGRRHVRSRFRGPALGYLLHHGADSVWFAGDTGLFAGMGALGPVQVGLVPVGGWGPTLGPEHLDPAGAAEAVRLVGVRDAVPIHYGTFWPMGLRHVQPATYHSHFLSPGQRFAEELARACPAAHAHVLAAGEHVILGPDAP